MPHTGQQTKSILSTLSTAGVRTEALTVPRTLDLVDHVVHVIITVDVTLAAVGVLGILLLVLDHSCI